MAYITAYLSMMLACSSIGLLAGRLSKQKRIIFCLLALTLLVINGALKSRPEVETAIFPWSNYIYFSNWGGPLTLLILCIGLRNAATKWQKCRLILLCAILFSVLLYTDPYLLRKGPKNLENNVIENGIVLQTSEATCGAAGAATLLKQYGIDTTEQEIADLSLTKQDWGVHTLGLYRAIKIKAGQKKLEVKVVRSNWEGLKTLPKPCLITASLNERTQGRARAELLETWTPGVKHTVVVLDVIDDNKVLIADPGPDYGLEQWPKRHFLRTMGRQSYRSLWEEEMISNYLGETL